VGVSLYERRERALRLVEHLDPVESFQDLLPKDAQLEFCEPASHAEVGAPPERQVPTGVGAFDVEGLAADQKGEYRGPRALGIFSLSGSVQIRPIRVTLPSAYSQTS
jgi:hypothetical protein